MSLFLQAFLVALAVTIAFIDAHTTQTPVSYTHLDVYKRQGWIKGLCIWKLHARVTDYLPACNLYAGYGFFELR